MMVRGQAAFRYVAKARLSSNSKVVTDPTVLKAGALKVEKFRKFNEQSASPKSLTQVLGTGIELHVPKNISEVAVLSEMPREQAERTVVIGQRINKSLQSGTKFVNQWQITWKNQERWSNPLMGWTSTADPMSNVKLTFDTREEAEHFAMKNGWKAEVLQPSSKGTVEPGSYLYKHNFLSKKISMAVKKEGQKYQGFANPNYGASHFFMPLKYHGNGEVVQHGPPVLSGNKQ